MVTVYPSELKVVSTPEEPNSIEETKDIMKVNFWLQYFILTESLELLAELEQYELCAELKPIVYALDKVDINNFEDLQNVIDNAHIFLVNNSTQLKNYLTVKITSDLTEDGLVREVVVKENG